MAIITPIPLAYGVDIDSFLFVRTDVIVFGETFNVPVFDLWEVFNLQKGYHSQLMTPFVDNNGRLNAAGNAKISDALNTLIVRNFPDLENARNESTTFNR